jgi:uncharacterized protein (UPF0276 family)
MHPARPAAAGPVGVGFKPAHLAAILSGTPPGTGLGFFEVHAENCMVAGGPVLAQLDALRRDHALSVHGVGLSIGGEDPLDATHLQRLQQVLQRFQPRWFSEHLAWSSHGGEYFNDLLPLPYDQATLNRVCDHIDALQHRLRRQVLLENPSSYVAFASSTFDEAEFLAAVVRRTGCGLLLDVNNAYVSAVNHGGDAQAFIDALPAQAVGEIHLAGHAVDQDAAGAPLLIDDHGSPVSAAVWALYRHAVARLGAVPTLIERDNDVPAFDVLRAEALAAAACMADVLTPQACAV